MVLVFRLVVLNPTESDPDEFLRKALWGMHPSTNEAIDLVEAIKGTLSEPVMYESALSRRRSGNTVGVAEAKEVYEKCGKNSTKAAKILKIPRSTLRGMLGKEEEEP